MVPNMLFWHEKSSEVEIELYKFSINFSQACDATSDVEIFICIKIEKGSSLWAEITVTINKERT